MNAVIKYMTFLIALVAVDTTVFAKTFIGRMEIVTFQNMDKTTQRFSSGIGYNGACREIVLVGENGLLVENKSLRFSKLIDADKGRVYIWCNGLGEGIDVDYNEYMAVFSTFSNRTRTYLGVELQKYNYDLRCDSDSIISFGKDAISCLGRIECKSSGTDIKKCVYIPAFESPQFLQCVLQDGFNVDGLVVKFMWSIDTRVWGIKLKGYKGMEVQSIDWDYAPSKEDLTPPSGIVFKKKRINGVQGFYKKIGKYLRKNKLFPDQTGDEFIYEIDENEWNL